MPGNPLHALLAVAAQHDRAGSRARGPVGSRALQPAGWRWVDPYIWESWR